MSEQRERSLDRSLNVRRWWLLALALVVAPAIGLYRIAGTDQAAETAAQTASRLAVEHTEGCGDSKLGDVGETREVQPQVLHALDAERQDRTGGRSLSVRTDSHVRGSQRRGREGDLG